jgi:hypothetical protein
LTTRDMLETLLEQPHSNAVNQNKVLLLARLRRTPRGARLIAAYLREINVTKICVIAISFCAALAVLPAAAQTGYG